MLVSSIVAGFIAGLASGGDWRRLQEFGVAWWPVLLTSILARAIAPFTGAAALAWSVLGLALVVAVAIANRMMAGAVVIAVGSLLNLLVTVLNGGMPVDPAALTLAGKSMPVDGLHVILGETTRLGFLSDVILVPVVNTIYSVGDFALALGGFWMAFRVVRPR